MHRPFGARSISIIVIVLRELIAVNKKNATTPTREKGERISERRAYT